MGFCYPFQPDFSKKTEFFSEHGGPVSTNAVEGLFGRFKRHVRVSKQVMNPQKTNYGHRLGEFLFIEKFLNARRLQGKSWRGVAFLQLVRFLGAFAWTSTHASKPPPFQIDAEDGDVFSEFEQEWWSGRS